MRTQSLQLKRQRKGITLRGNRQGAVLVHGCYGCSPPYSTHFQLQSVNHRASLADTDARFAERTFTYERKFKLASQVVYVLALAAGTFVSSRIKSGSGELRPGLSSNTIPFK